LITDGYKSNTAHSKEISKVLISNCGTYAVTVSKDKTGKIWNLEN